MYQSDISPEIRRVIDMLRARPMSELERQHVIDNVKTMSSSTSGDYILSVLFPELHEPTRFPMVFPNPTAVFKLTEVYDFYPGLQNKFFIEYFPQNISYESDPNKLTNGFLYIYKHYDATKNSNTGGFDYTGDATDPDKIKDAGVSYTDTVGDYFEQVVLRAATIKIYYVGEFEKMSGYFESCIDYFYDPTAEKYPQEAEVTKGFYRQFAMPHEGMRCIWLPKDYKDYNFEKVSTATDKREPSRICIYGTGLESEPLRIEVTRHFEGFPKTFIRDYIDTRRPVGTSAQKTMESIGKIHSHANGLITIKPKDVVEVHNYVARISNNFDYYVDQL